MVANKSSRTRCTLRSEFARLTACRFSPACRGGETVVTEGKLRACPMARRSHLEATKARRRNELRPCRRHAVARRRRNDAVARAGRADCDDAGPLSLFPQTNFPRIIIVVETARCRRQQMMITGYAPDREAMAGMPRNRAREVHYRASERRNRSLLRLAREHRARPCRWCNRACRGSPDPATRRDRDSRGRLTFAVFPIIAYSVTSPKRDPGTLRTLVELTIRHAGPRSECRRWTIRPGGLDTT